MSEQDRKLDRRHVLKSAGGLAATVALIPHLAQAAPSPSVAVRAVANQDGEITGGDLEVGVFYEEGAWFDHAKSIGDSLEADFPGTRIKYTFANTASDPARALRWQNGDPLDVDVARWSNPAPVTWDWVDNGFVYDMTANVEQPLADGTPWKDTFTAAAASFVVDSREGAATPGAYWGVPFEQVLMLVHYNVDLFEQAGVSPPTTWDEFLAVCETLKAAGIQPICVSGPTAPYCAHWWDRLTQRIVGEEAVRDVAFGDALAADNPGFLQAAQELAKFRENDWFMKGFEGADFTTAQALFFQGQAAMIHMGSWLSAEMADVIAELPNDFRLGVFDFPAYEGGAGDQNAGFGTAQIFSIADPARSNSHDVNVPLAVEYLRRWTSKENSTIRADTLKMISAVQDVPAPAGVEGLDEAIARSSESPAIIYYYAIHWDTNLSTAWWNPVQALFLGVVNPEEMITMLDEGLEQYRQIRNAGS